MSRNRRSRRRRQFTQFETLEARQLLAGDVAAAVQTADLNGDGNVGFADFLTLSANFGKHCVGHAGGDVDGDGRVAFGDFLAVSGQFGGPGVVQEAPGVVNSNPAAAPRVVGAVAPGNTCVIVHFSESMGDSALDTRNYSIVQENVNPEAGALLITDAKFTVPDNSAVKLTTMSQNELTYRVSVSGVRDLDGTDLSGKLVNNGVLLDPTSAAFAGTPPSGPEIVDTDGDGLTDNEEQRGWIVSVTLSDGTVTERGVTSDPKVADTDGDGFTDNKELELHLDPRDKDTDDDGLEDEFEFNTVFSSPSNQDTDGDGLGDGSEHNFFHTSALLADTDGDQFLDSDEVITDNRNPRLADLPRIEINTGNVDLTLDVRFEKQDSEGTSTIDTKSVNTTLVRAQEDTTASSSSSSNSSTTEWFVKAGASGCYSAGCPSDTGKWGFSVSAEGGFTSSRTSSSTSESSQQAQRAFSRTLSTDKTKEQEVSAESVVTRLVEGASMAVEVDILNASNVAFAVSDIEITALTQDPRDPTEFIPVATLVREIDDVITIGPLNPARGPFRFKAIDTFPSVVESLLENPRPLIFKVANYEIVDEFDRNFSFVEQDVNDRTAFLEIDYAGNLPLEKYRAATNSEYDTEGRPTGLPMDVVLQEILGLERVPPEEDEMLAQIINDARQDPQNPLPIDPAVIELLDNSYSTRMEPIDVDGDGIPDVDENGDDILREVLYRVKDVSPDLVDGGDLRKWWVITPNGLNTPLKGKQLLDDDGKVERTTIGAPGRDFSSTVVFADQAFAFKFVQDLDDDSLEASQEGLYGTRDAKEPCLTRLFGVPHDPEDMLVQGPISDALRTQFEENGHMLPEDAEIRRDEEKTRMANGPLLARAMTVVASFTR